MIIGTTNTQIDWFNNPYIAIEAIVIDQTMWTSGKSHSLKIRYCTQTDLLKFMSEEATNYYPNSICLDDSTHLHMLNSWYADVWENIQFIITACDQSTYQGTCKTEEEIDQFLRNNIFYFVTQKTTVDKTIYEHQ